MTKKVTASQHRNTIQRLKKTAKKEGVIKSKLKTTAKKLATTAKRKEVARKKLRVTAKKKESVRAKLAITAKKLVAIAKEKESIRIKLVSTAKQLAVTAREAKAANEELRTLLESIGDGVIAIDRSWNITLFNKAARSISGLGKDEVIGKPFREIIKFIKEKTRDENISFIEEAMLFGKTSFVEEDIVLVKKDGSEIPLGDSAAPIFDSDNKVIGAIIIFRDLSKERENQRMRSDFAYASHQLRTPVTKAIWNIEIALDEKADIEKIRELVLISYNSMRSVQKLVDELLEVSELDQGTIMNKDSKPTNIVELLKQSVSLAQPRAKSKDIEISFLSTETPININTNSKFLKRIVFEILDNAIQYSRIKGVVKISAISQKDGILIEIEDNGIGIPQEHQPAIFTKFFRGDNFDTTTIMGAGLGLYISREYVKLIKGKIWFKSEDGNGTIFSIFLPNA